MFMLKRADEFEMLEKTLDEIVKLLKTTAPVVTLPRGILG